MTVKFHHLRPPCFFHQNGFSVGFIHQLFQTSLIGYTQSVTLSRLSFLFPGTANKFSRAEASHMKSAKSPPQNHKPSRFTLPLQTASYWNPLPLARSAGPSWPVQRRQRGGCGTVRRPRPSASTGPPAGTRRRRRCST